MAHEVFICHSSQDSETARSICSTLEAERIRCWIAPRNIPPGMAYSTAIVKAIEESRVVLLVISQNSNTSQHVLREIELAVNRQLIIIPLRIEDMALSSDLQYFLGPYQWFDGFPGPLDDHARKLARYLGRLLKRPQPRGREVERKQPQGAAAAGGSSGAMVISLTIIGLLLSLSAVAFVGRKYFLDTPPSALAAASPAVVDRTPEKRPADSSPPVAATPKTLVNRLEELRAEFASKAGGKSDEERGRLFEQAKVARRLMDLIGQDREAPEVADALLWAFENSRADPSVLMADTSSTSTGTWPDPGSWEWERLLRAVQAKHPDAMFRGVACLSLARRLKERSRTEAETLLERALTELKEAGSRAARFAELADAELFELTRLSVGMPAPEILGPDAGGKLLRLSDQRGKLVVLGFWSELSASGALGDLDLWLGDRFRGQPMVLLGVNADTKAVARDLALEGRAGPWKVWLDGKPISARWNVRGQTSIFVIDHAGVIRNRFSGQRTSLSEELGLAVASLIRAVPAQSPGVAARPVEVQKGPAPQSHDHQAQGSFPVLAEQQADDAGGSRRSGRRHSGDRPDDPRQRRAHAERGFERPSGWVVGAGPEMDEAPVHRADRRGQHHRGRRDEPLGKQQEGGRQGHLFSSARQAYAPRSSRGPGGLHGHDPGADQAVPADGSVALGDSLRQPGG